uniref:Uncharacterized protein n=1 Tax=Papio anubis TaxID=9555 RepID=A0A8I5NKZ1_PAPAN
AKIQPLHSSLGDRARLRLQKKKKKQKKKPGRVRVLLCHPGLELLGSSSPPTSASQSARITGACHHARLIFVFLVEMGIHHVGRPDLKLLTSGALHTLASQSAGITGVSHCAQPNSRFLSKKPYSPRESGILYSKC